jgi:competence protein ComEC
MEHLVLVDQGRLKRELPHVGASSAILKMMRVGWVADSGQRYGGHAYNDALAQARIHHVAVIVPGCHQRWLDDEITLTFLSSCGPPLTDGANDVNENSLVVLLQYRTLRVLFMGDAGFQSEERLLAEGVDVHADIRHPTSDIRHPTSAFGILKVGHHGSAYSSGAAFIDAVHPRIAIVSVGRHNLFGHPAPVTLETLHATGASIFRTDQRPVRSCNDSNRAADRLSVKSMLSCAPTFR